MLYTSCTQTTIITVRHKDCGSGGGDKHGFILVATRGRHYLICIIALLRKLIPAEHGYGERGMSERGQVNELWHKKCHHRCNAMRLDKSTLIHSWYCDASRALKVAHRCCLQCHALLEFIIIDLLND